ncbi:hypothetical protein OGAPHI_006434 [Ogataea philodendri]|uniref:Protein PXR1 n=1 Tax=Ogataea philodendri TaxID=1378263 RepID=A0A9P8NYJ0_9ASCO|nr:uncharacterized protein OGAPHI_006434 [Ogataea philodendri]KAH3661586.1 hypothetical protein OGAPHI_006434 [Ogataea philodendri]
MGLGAPRAKQRFGLDPRNTNWSNDFSRFGHKHLEKFGWKPGQGLGLTNNATTSHIKVVIKKDNAGLGASLARRSNKDDDLDTGDSTGLDVFQRLLGRLNGKEAETNAQMDKLQQNRIINGRWGINFVPGDVLRSTWDKEAKSLKGKEDGQKKEKKEKKVKKEMKEKKEKKVKKEKKKEKKEKKEKKDKKEKKEKHKDKESRKRKGEDLDGGSKRTKKSKSKKLTEKDDSLAPIRDRSGTPPVTSGRMALRQKWIRQKRMAVEDSKALQEIFMSPPRKKVENKERRPNCALDKGDALTAPAFLELEELELDELEELELLEPELEPEEPEDPEELEEPVADGEAEAELNKEAQLDAVETLSFKEAEPLKSQAEEFLSCSSRDLITVGQIADGSEEVTVIILVNTAVNDTGQRRLQTFTNVIVRSWWQVGRCLPVGLTGWAAKLGSRSRSSRSRSSGWRSTSKLGLQVVVVVQSRNTVTVDGNQTVVVLLLEVHVHDTTRPDICHFIGVQSLNLGELSWSVSVTTVLGEEGWDGEVGELLSSVLVTRAAETRVTTPLVHVDTVEISLDVIVTTSEEVCGWDSGLGVIIGGVTNRNVSVSTVLHVLFHISDGSFNEWGSIGVGRVGDHLITGKETEDIVVLVEHVNDRGVSLVQVHGPGRTGGLDGLFRSGKIRDHVNSGILEQLHTSIVVSRGVDSIDSDDVDSEVLEVLPPALFEEEDVVLEDEPLSEEPVDVAVEPDPEPEALEKLPVTEPVPSVPAALKIEEQLEAVEPLTRLAEPLKSHALEDFPSFSYHGGNSVVINHRNKTIIVRFLVVHVHDTTRPDIGHLVGVKCLHLGELSWLLGITTVLGEEHRNSEVGELFGSVLVTRSLESGVTTPFVHVDSIEVSTLIIVTTGEIVSRSDSGFGVIVSRVSDRNTSVSAALHVLLHISDSCLNEWGSIGVGRVGDHLITSKESENVVVLLHHIDNGDVSVVQFLRPRWISGGNRQRWLGKVCNHVDASVLQQRHTVGMVFLSVQSINSDHVGVQLFQVRDISLASGLVNQRINEGCVRRARGVALISDSSNIKLRSVVRIEELVSNNFDSWETRIGLRDSSHKATQNTNITPRNHP